MPEKSWANVIQSVCKMENEDVKAKSLGWLASNLPENYSSEIFNMANSIKKENLRRHAFAGIAPYLPPDLKRRAIRNVLMGGRYGYIYIDFDSRFYF